MKTLAKLIYGSIFTFCLFTVACKKREATRTPSQILASVNWVTTKVVNKGTGESLSLTEAPASTYVGLATYNENGSFEFRNLDGTTRQSNFARGDWGVSLNGRIRILVFSANNDGQRIPRVVAVTELTNNKFTYEIADSLTINSSKQPVTLSVEHEPRR